MSDDILLIGCNVTVPPGWGGKVIRIEGERVLVELDDEERRWYSYWDVSKNHIQDQPEVKKE